MSLEELMSKYGITQDELGGVIAVTGSAVNHKLAGRRPWLKSECDQILAWLPERTGQTFTYEQVFNGTKAA